MKWKLILLFLLLGWQAKAQTKISGEISDDKGDPLIGANIYIEGTYDGTSSDERGCFTLITSEQGDRVLIVNYLGFESYQASVYLNGKTIELEIKLKEAFNELTAVTISAGTFEAGDKKKSVSMNSIDMVTTAGTAGDIIGAMQTLPGTTTVGESGRLYVKGGDSRESKTFIDGTLVFVPYTSSSPNSAVRGRFSPFMFSGTMFSTGGYSAEYGQALSSVLSLKTTDVEVEDQLNISLLAFGSSLEGSKSWKTGSVKANLGYFNLKPYMQLVPQNDEWINEPQSINGDVGFRMKTPKSGLFKLYTNINTSALKLQQSHLNQTDSLYAYGLKNENVFVNASWAGELNPKLILFSGVSYTYNADKATIDTINNDNKLQGFHSKLSLKYLPGEKVKLNSGIELFAKNYSNCFYANGYSQSNKFKNYTFAAYSESEVYASQHFVTRLGIRLEHSGYLNKTSIAPRVSTAYKLSDKGQLSFAYGWFFQNPDDKYMANASHLEFERADHFTLNYIWQNDDRIIRSEIYYKDYTNLIKFNQAETNPVSYYQSNGVGNAYGFDLFWRDKKTIRFAEYWISYSYINAQRNYLDFPYSATPDFTSKHNLSLVYKHWVSSLRSSISGTYKFSSPRVYNNPNSSEFNNEQTIPYQTLDISWAFLFRQNVFFHCSVSNVLGFKQEFGKQYAQVPDADGHYNSKSLLPGSKRFYIVGCFITLSKKGDLNQMDKIN